MKSHSCLLSYQPSLCGARQSIVTLVYLALGLFIVGCSDDSSTPVVEAPPAVEKPVDAPDEVGPFAVGHTRMEFIDVLRGNRVLPADIWYPADMADTGDASRTLYPLQAPLVIESELSVDDVPLAPGARRGLLVFSHGFGGTNTQSTPSKVCPPASSVRRSPQVLRCWRTLAK